jgi:hypothetical protein
MHSRFGLKGSVGEGDLKAGGLVELDFFASGGFATNLNPRMRQAYAWIQAGNFGARFGQQWDIFSPVNASTANTNGNMWFTGNLGFRRAMIQLMYEMPLTGLTPKLQLGVAEAIPDGSGFGIDNLSGQPMIQGRLSATFMTNYCIGVGFMTATLTPEPDTSSYDYSASAYGIDFNLPFHSLFAVKGEASMGTNVRNVTMFSIAGMGNHELDKENMAVWLNATSHLHPMVVLVLGFGTDMNQAEDADFMVGNVKSNTAIYGDLIFPFHKYFSLTLEVESISTDYVTAMVNNAPETETFSALVIMVSGKVTF